MCTSSGTATFRKQEEEAVHQGPGATLDMHLLGVGPAGTVLGSALSTLPSGDGLRARGGGPLLPAPLAQRPRCLGPQHVPSAGASA